MTNSFLKEGERLEECGGAYIIRSSFYSQPRTIEEIIQHLKTELTDVHKNALWQFGLAHQNKNICTQ